MPYTYKKQSGDKQYRMVSLMVENLGDWLDFTEEKVEYPEQCVLEILREDKTTRIEYERIPQGVSAGIMENTVFLPAEIPVARLWIRGAGGMMYKVPAGIKAVDGRTHILIPGGIQNVTLCGDEYFNRVYAVSIS